MSDKMSELIEYVTSSTRVFRKGEVVKTSPWVVTIDNFPEKSPATNAVDCHFVSVGFTEHAPTLSHREFYDLILEAEHGEFADLPLSRLQAGPSYIEIGGWLGSQTLAFQFMALGQAHELWTVITPATLHVEGPDADQMAGMGFVMISGIKEPGSVQ